MEKKKILTSAFSSLFILITAISCSADILQHEFQVPEDTSSEKENQEGAKGPLAQLSITSSLCCTALVSVAHTTLARHMPSWLSYGIHLVTHSTDQKHSSFSHTSTYRLLSPSCHNTDASRTAKLVSRDCEAQTHTGKLDILRHKSETQFYKPKSKNGYCDQLHDADC